MYFTYLMFLVSFSFAELSLIQLTARFFDFSVTQNILISSVIIGTLYGFLLSWIISLPYKRIILGKNIQIQLYEVLKTLYEHKDKIKKSGKEKTPNSQEIKKQCRIFSEKHKEKLKRSVVGRTRNEKGQFVK